MSDELLKNLQKERAVCSARIFFIVMVICLQIAFYYAKGGKFQFDISQRTIFSFDMPWNKWVFGILALGFLIWALVVLLTARSDRLTHSKVGQWVEQSNRISLMLAVIVIAFGWVQGVLSALQAGLGEWYFSIVFILGLTFLSILVFLPIRRIRRETTA